MGWLCVPVIVLAMACPVHSQGKKELQRKKDALHKEIEYTNKLLDQTSRNKKSSISQLVTLKRKISARTELIRTIHQEIGGLDRQIDSVSGNIDSLEARLNVLKQQYASLLFFAYKSQSAYSRLSFILSASDFNQAYKRMRYLRHLGEYRIRQQQLIVQLQDSLGGKRRTLQDSRTEKSGLLTSQQKEKGKLDAEQKQKVRIIDDLGKQEKKLRADLKKKQRDEEKLARRIEDIIRKEIEAARKKAEEQARKSGKKATGSSVLALTPEAIRLSNDFAGNKGKLPWPVEQGVISSTFGRHAHPVWKDVVINNNGIDINSTDGAQARAIFNGTVLRVILVVDKYAVLVQHGEYFTLYSNLREVLVKAGDKVVTKQAVGIIQTDQEDGKTLVHLEVWKGSNKMDPEGWIMSRGRM
jgi:septal ring factor EnvC (AmiA/AmiB activator)